MLIGIDVGTSSVKAALLSEEAQLLATRIYPLQRRLISSPVATQEPSEWIEAIRFLIGELAPISPSFRALGFVANCSTLVVTSEVDPDASKLALLWCDSQAANEAELINNTLGDDSPPGTVTPFEPASRFLRLIRVGDTKPLLMEAATWIAIQLTREWMLPESIFHSRWGILSNVRLRHRLFDRFPYLEQPFECASRNITPWEAKIGNLKIGDLPTKHEATAAVYCAGNDGLSSIFGTGRLFDKQFDFEIGGTSHLLITRNLHKPSDALFWERLPSEGILFGQQLYVRSLTSSSPSPTPSLLNRCLIGGRYHRDMRPLDGRSNSATINCGRYVGAVAAAAYAGIAEGVLPSDPVKASGLIATIWDRSVGGPK